MSRKKYLKESIKLGDRELTVETGKVAKQADGSVVIKYGETMVLVSAVSTRTPKEGLDFFPLTVEYREAGYSAGRIPGNYFRREGRPNEKEVLTCRLIDRPVRPLFPDGYRYETQIVGSVISSDSENDPDVIAITGAEMTASVDGVPVGPRLGTEVRPGARLEIGAIRRGFGGQLHVVEPERPDLVEQQRQRPCRGAPPLAGGCGSAPASRETAGPRSRCGSRGCRRCR